ncbi:MAG: iron-containing redox enzyme family protein [Pseudomonadota bacterium]
MSQPEQPTNTLHTSQTFQPGAAMHETFTEVIADFNDCEGMQRLWRGDLDRGHYAALMREVFHHTRENPQLQALATVFFRGEQRSMVKPFLRHAISEVGHDQLALNDAQSCGLDVSSVPSSQPLPATTALLAYPFYQIYNNNAVGYLGYLYFLEAMPTAFGERYMMTLAAMGVDRTAMSFLQDHTTIDVGHTKAMQGYIQQLITSEAELTIARYAMKVTGELYSNMVTAAFASADDADGYGANPEEIAA